MCYELRYCLISLVIDWAWGEGGRSMFCGKLDSWIFISNVKLGHDIIFVLFFILYFVVYALNRVVREISIFGYNWRDLESSSYRCFCV